VSEIECAHAKILLKVWILSNELFSMEENVETSYRCLVAASACKVWDRLPKNWGQKPPKSKRRTILALLHADCCRDGRKIGTGPQCHTNRVVERDVIQLIREMVVSLESYTRARALAIAEPCVLLRRPVEEVMSRTRRRLQRLRNNLVCSFLPQAMWKKKLGKDTTPLEGLLVDKRGRNYLGLEAQVTISAVEDTLRCAGNNRLCRGCYKRDGVYTRACGTCERVYFCSETCLMTCTTGRHRSYECGILTKQNKAKTK